MPTPADVREQLTDVVVQVLGCRSEDVVPDAVFTDLGSDSLTIVEIGEEIGRRFDLYLSDQAIDELVTVQDAIDAVVEGRGTPLTEPEPAALVAAPAAVVAGPATVAVPAAPVTAAAPSAPSSDDDTFASFIDDVPADADRKAWRAGGWMTVTGILIGGVIGLLALGVVAATGLRSVSLPPLPSSAEVSTPTPTPTETTPEPTEEPDTPEPTLQASGDRVSPGSPFVLSGELPGVDEGTNIDIEFREGNGDWERFPVDTQTRGGGAFKAELYTSRTGEREFRVRGGGETTPTVKVTIG